MIVIAIVIGLQTVGVVLMSAMIIAPAAAARQWTDRLGVMVILAAFFGGVSGVIGALISSTAAHIPTGPTIVLVISAVAAFSMLLAPNRGLLWSWARRKRSRKQLQLQAVLEDLYLLARQHKDMEHAHPIEVLRAMSAGHGGVDRSLKELQSRGWARKIVIEGWALTQAGREEAEHLAGRVSEQHDSAAG